MVSYVTLSGFLVLFLKVKPNLFYNMLYIHIPFDTYKQKPKKKKIKVNFFFCVESIVGNFIALSRTMAFHKVPSSYQHILKAFAQLSWVMMIDARNPTNAGSCLCL